MIGIFLIRSVRFGGWVFVVVVVVVVAVAVAVAEVGVGIEDAGMRLMIMAGVRNDRLVKGLMF